MSAMSHMSPASAPSARTSSAGRRRVGVSRPVAGMLAVLLGAGAAIAVAPAGATAVEPCTFSRAFSLAMIRDGAVSAGAVGTGRQRERDQIPGRWRLEVSDSQAEYLAESIDGGCTPMIEFTTEGTTSALGRGRASYRAAVQLRVNGVELGPRLVESATYPMFGCASIVCQRHTDHAAAIDRALVAGDVMTVTSSAVAEAVAGGRGASDQAHADWQVDSPLLRVPIP